MTEEQRANRKAYIAANKDKINAQRRARRKSHPPTEEQRVAAREYHREWHRANPEKDHQYSTKWRKKNLKHVRERGYAWQRANPEKREVQHWRGHIVSTYGITEAQYEAIRESQRGVCAICGGLNGKKRLAIDHDHETGEIRGLLCSKCNVGIGMLRDDPSLLESAARYLRRTKEKAA